MYEQIDLCYRHNINWYGEYIDVYIFVAKEKYFIVVCKLHTMMTEKLNSSKANMSVIE